MELQVYQEYLRRAESADTVRELHRVALEVQTTHPGDPDADLVDRACWMHAQRLVERGRLARAVGRQTRGENVADWKERAAPI